MKSFGSIAQPGWAFASHAKGQEFEPPCFHFQRISESGFHFVLQQEDTGISEIFFLCMLQKFPCTKTGKPDISSPYSWGAWPDCFCAQSVVSSADIFSAHEYASSRSVLSYGSKVSHTTKRIGTETLHRSHRLRLMGLEPIRLPTGT